MSKKIRTFQEAMDDIRKNAPESAVFNILGYNVELNRECCTNYEGVCKNIREKAPDELFREMNELSPEEFVEVLGSLISRVQLTFGEFTE